jgi:hypothetical protein
VRRGSWPRSAKGPAPARKLRWRGRGDGSVSSVSPKWRATTCEPRSSSGVSSRLSRVAVFGIFLLAPGHALLAAGAEKEQLPRVNYDRADDVTGPQVHVMYVLPSDGIDRHFDIDGTIEGSVSAFQTWLRGQASGRSLRIDTYQDSVDLTFFQLSRTDSEIAGQLAFDRSHPRLRRHVRP